MLNDIHKKAHLYQSWHAHLPALIRLPMSYLIDFRESGLKTAVLFGMQSNLFIHNVEEKQSSSMFFIGRGPFNAQLSLIGPLPRIFSQAAPVIIEVNYRGGARTTSRNLTLIATTLSVHTEQEQWN